MFLFERLFGIFTYMLVLISVCFLLAKTNITCKAALRIYLICLCIMAFFYKPNVTADLYRIFDQMEYFSSMEFGLFWSDFVLKSSTPVSRLLFWCFGKTGCNALLPAFSALLCYSLIFYIVKRTKQLYDISNQTVAIVLFFIMTTSMYISAISGIRMMIALSMLTFSCFRVTVERKIRVLDVLFIILSICIHMMSFVVIGIIALTYLFDSDRNALKKIGYVLAIGLFGGILVVGFSDALRGLVDKFLSYVLGEKHSDPWEYLMGVFIILTLLLVLFEIRFIRKAGHCLEIGKCNMAAVFCIILAICFCLEFSIFYRFGGHLAVLFSIPSMMAAIEKTKGKSSKLFAGIDLRTLVIVFSCIIAVISCARGSLCSLKFFEL